MRKHQQAEHHEESHLRDEGDPFVKRGQLTAIARRRAADRQSHEIDGEESASPDGVCSSE